MCNTFERLLKLLKISQMCEECAITGVFHGGSLVVLSRIFMLPGPERPTKLALKQDILSKFNCPGIADEL